MKKILIIQTAFIGDVVLATALIEKLHQYHPDALIDFLVRKGNESLLNNNPYLHEVIAWNKKRKQEQESFKYVEKRSGQKNMILLSMCSVFFLQVF